MAEAMRNVACVGATPSGLTDCLNYGNPERGESFWQFGEGVRGLSDAAKNLWLKGHPEVPVPIVSGNVSFYNESARGVAVAPSPIVTCIGIIEDYSLAITMRFKEPGSRIYLVGERYDELGGSEYYRRIFGELGKNVPKVRYEEERGAIYGVTDCIQRGCLKSAHDISGGGLAVTLAEMMICGHLGVEVDLEGIESSLRMDKTLFSESSGFVLEVPPEKSPDVLEVFRSYGIRVFDIGSVVESSFFTVKEGNTQIMKLPLSLMEEAWKSEIWMKK